MGTWSDEKIVEILKIDKEYASRLNIYNPRMDTFISDERIKSEVIDQARTPVAFTHFFAKNLNDAKRMAKEMGLKNFSQVSDTLYQQGKDY